MSCATTARMLACWMAAALLSACSLTQIPQIRPTSGAPTTHDDPERMVVVTLAKPASAGLRGAGSTWRGWDMGGGDYQVGVDVQGAVTELARRYALQEVDAWPIALLGVHCVVFHIQGNESRETLLRKLADDTRVESAQAMQVFATAGMRSVPREMQYSLKAMQIEPAHRWAQGRGVIVAVIDTGMDYAHPQLKDRVVRHFDFVGRSDTRFEDDRHGTAVGGVIAAADDPQGMVGVAPRAEILALQGLLAIASRCFGIRLQHVHLGACTCGRYGDARRRAQPESRRAARRPAGQARARRSGPGDARDRRHARGAGRRRKASGFPGNGAGCHCREFDRRCG